MNKLTAIPKALASLQLTVVLLALAMFLVFAGTLAQVDQGIYAVLSQYFRTIIAWVDLQIFFPRHIEVTGSVPYPGGYLLGGILLVNLIAAHAVRFKLSAKRSGIILIHVGLIIMLLSELLTGLYAEEGVMPIEEGHTTHFVESLFYRELAIIDRSAPETEDVVVVPEAMLKREGEVVRDEALPFDVRVDRWMTNAALQPAGDRPNPATAGDGQWWVALEQPPVSGADASQMINASAVYVTFLDKQTGDALGTYLVPLMLYRYYNRNGLDRPQVIEHDGTEYHVYLRFKRSYRPYRFELIDFQHERYPGTDRSKSFASVVRILDDEHTDAGRRRIYMNHPLRYAGETFYQAAYFAGESGTVLQVVKNPARWLPYISCGVVVLGMCVQFGIGLSRFSKRRPT